MRLVTLQFERKLQKSIRMGITIFKIFILGGISSDISGKSCFTATRKATLMRRQTKFPTVYPTINVPK